MHWIDWLIVLVPLLLVAAVSFYTQRHVKSVSDFLVGGRVAGRYLLTVAGAEAGMGLITIIAWFEAHYANGYAYGFWGGFTPLLTIFITLTGFAIYRYRETRAMTMAQFFELRYSKRFRIFTGGLSAFAGIFNYGIFPAVGGRFFIYYCDLPVTLTWGGWSIPTIAVVMFAFLSIAVLLVTLGGQLTIMVSDALQGLLSYPLYVVIFFAVIYLFTFAEIETAVLDRPPGKSYMNPFDIGELRDFNLFFVMVGVFASVYNRLSWQGSQGYNAAAINAHEQKMAGVLGAWRSGFSMMAISFVTIAAFTYMHHDSFAAGAEMVNRNLAIKTLNADHAAALNGVDPKTLSLEELTHIADGLEGKERQTYNAIVTQMTVPVAIRAFLPVGITGAFCAVMIFFLISTDTTYLHSWGSILIQDLIVPLRKDPLQPRTQMLLLRLAAIGVALYAFVFSLFFAQINYIFMFFALTGSVYLGGAGACILGGLYWKRGTAAGAWATMIVGACLAISAFTGQQMWADTIYPWLAARPALHDSIGNGLVAFSNAVPGIAWELNAARFPINGQEMYFFTMLGCIAVYVGVSLLTCREPYNLERLLHRGKYRAAADDRAPGRAGEVPAGPVGSFRGALRKLLGIDHQYTRGDRILAWSVFLWTLFTVSLWGLKIVWNLIWRWPDYWWTRWWWYQAITLGIGIGLVTTVWFTWGTTRDLFRMFRRLNNLERDDRDDGRVFGHVNADEVDIIEQIEDAPDPTRGPVVDAGTTPLPDRLDADGVDEEVDPRPERRP